jgi:putative membrane-bound dehydrogenase-like protein
VSRPSDVFLLLFAAAAVAPAVAADPDPGPVLRVPEGFVAEKVAGDPDVVFPMFAELDERGRLFVAESSGLDLYEELEKLTRRCRVKLLEDADGDGRYERSRVFADSLVFPMGLAWRDGKLYVADPPDLAVLEDADGDGKADSRRSILTGFGHKDNGSLHGLTFGPDGLLYMTMGSPDGYRLRRGDGSFIEGKSGALIRCRPDGSDPEVLARGFDNLVEVVFTPHGEMIGTDNWFQLPAGGIRDALVHLADGGFYPRQTDEGTPFPITGDPLPAAELFPAVALSGLAIYRGTAFPPGMAGDLFSAQHNARKVGRHRLERDGSTFKAREIDFVSSEHPDFHPSDVLEAPDGSLLVVDTGGWYVHHCPTGRIRDSRAPGGIHRIRRAGARAPADPLGLAVAWDVAAPEALARLLGDARPAVADRAGRTLAARGAPATAALAAVIADPGAETTAKSRALWALSSVPGGAAAGAIRGALDSREPRVAAVAARAAALRADAGAAAALSRLLARDEPAVRFAAAEALARAGDGESIPGILEALAAGPDRFLEHALIHALHRLADGRRLEQALEHASPRVRKAALILLDQPPRRGLDPARVLSRLGSPDADLRRAAVGILARHPGWASAAAGFLRGLVEKKDLAEDEETALRELIASFARDAAVLEVLSDALASRGDEARVLLILEALAGGDAGKLPPRGIAGIATLMERGSPALRPAAARLAVALGSPELDPVLERLARDAGAPAGLRVEALRSVVARRPALDAPLFDLCLRGLRDEEPLSRLSAAAVVARARLTEDQLLAVLDAVRTDRIVSPDALLPAIERSAAARSAGAAIDYLGVALREGWRPREDDLERAARAFPEAVREEALGLIAILREAAEADRARLRGLEPLAEGGDPARGREIFLGRKGACSTCHRVGAEGGLVGPDLTRIGAVRSARDLLESIVLPSSTFAQGYETHAVVTADGEAASGIIARQSADGVVLRLASGAEARFARESIRVMERSAASLMPDGLDRTLGEEDLRDLLAFLRSLR